MVQGWLARTLGTIGAGVIAVGALLTGALVPAAAALTDAPTLAEPADGTTLSDFNPTLQWTLPAAATQYHLEVIPAGNDGPGVDVIRNADTSFTIPAPPTWYVLLPDMTYSWRVQASDAPESIGVDDLSWSAWSEVRTFRTPRVTALSLSAVDPPPGGSVTGFYPTLTWATSDPSIWYFEVQVSQDPNFETDPAKAVAAVYWEIKHGDPSDDVTPDSYTIPAGAPLEPGATYYWRVRPRIQGDGQETPWGPNNRFTTPAPGAVYLDVTTPQDETVTSDGTLTVTGAAEPGCAVSVVSSSDLTEVTAGADGSYSTPVALDPGPNEIDVLATDIVTGDTVTVTRTITYSP